MFLLRYFVHGGLFLLLASCGGHTSVKNTAGSSESLPRSIERSNAAHIDFEKVPESDFSKALKPGNRILELEGWNVWGASPIMGEDGKVHVFFSRWPGGHGNWLRESEIAHAVADKPEGPYKVIGTVLKGRGAGYWDAHTIHNPTIHKVGDQYALFYIGNNLDSAIRYDGQHAATQRIGLALADDLAGPWRRVGDEPILDVSPDRSEWDSYLTTNPALLQHPDGNYWLYYKAWDRYNDKLRKMGVAIADKIEGPYKKYAGNPVVSFSDRGKQVEDAYVFCHREKFYMIMRDMGVIHPRVGLVLESSDGFHWSAPMVGYRTNVDYFPEKTMERFERPQILTINGKPSYLFLAVMGGKYGTSSAAVLKIDNSIFP